MCTATGWKTHLQLINIYIYIYISRVHCLVYVQKSLIFFSETDKMEKIKNIWHLHNTALSQTCSPSLVPFAVQIFYGISSTSTSPLFFSVTFSFIHDSHLTYVHSPEILLQNRAAKIYDHMTCNRHVYVLSKSNRQHNNALSDTRTLQFIN